MMPAPREPPPLGVMPRGVHPLEAIPGLTAEEAARLGRLGVHTTSDLCFANLPAVARASGITESHLRHWRDAAELLALQEVDPPFARQLLEAGVGSVRVLARLTPGDVERFVRRQWRRSGADDDGLLHREALPERCRRVVEQARQAEGM